MNDLLFTRDGDDYPFSECVRVSWAEGVFEFSYIVKDQLVTADRCREPNAAVVLDSFLLQLVRGE
jgi:hypothetical protein